MRPTNVLCQVYSGRFYRYVNNLYPSVEIIQLSAISEPAVIWNVNGKHNILGHRLLFMKLRQTWEVCSLHLLATRPIVITELSLSLIISISWTSGKGLQGSQ